MPGLGSKPRGGHDEVRRLRVARGVGNLDSCRHEPGSPLLQVAENDRGTPGTGSLPWTEVARALNEIDYRGRVVIETFSVE